MINFSVTYIEKKRFDNLSHQPFDFALELLN